MVGDLAVTRFLERAAAALVCELVHAMRGWHYPDREYWWSAWRCRCGRRVQL